MDKEAKHFRAVIYRNENDNLWLVRCLENNIAAQGKSIEESVQRLKLTFEAQAKLDKEKGVEAFANSKPAPQKFFDLFAKTNLKATSDLDSEELKTEYAVCA
ncbi:hypothetical protein [Leptospira santarosai]|uniref:hypothetical protein n=1 Tax=Leptospira santarosai TaxID=28183 RepID=UPI0002BE5F0F|nr:hypothetical protein [Leptospira santarosai]EMP02273.1 hypothetical protein LEP1GSC171_0272 [Leptospira santarosai str. HAI1380]MDI7181682.1 hypothetical protein [Leptospira santarosai]